MLGGGLESLIPKKKKDIQADVVDLKEEIEFKLPDIGSGRPMLAADTVVAPSEATEETREVETKPKYVFQIEVEKIKPNPQQPRRTFDEEALRELASSIREFGILQPLVVSKTERDTDTGRQVAYELIAGERRLKAAKMLGLPTVPVVVRDVDLDIDKLQLSVIENIQRTDLNPVESAKAMARLQDEFGMTQREIATKLGKSRAAIANAVRLLTLPTEIQRAIAEGTMSESHGRLILSLEDPGMQLAIFEEMRGSDFTVRDLENRIRRFKRGDTGAGGKISGPDPEIEALKEQLEEFLGTKVDVKREGRSGKIIISFYSQEELNAVLGKLFKQNGSQFL